MEGLERSESSEEDMAHCIIDVLMIRASFVKLGYLV